MKQLKFYKYTTIGLLILNIGVVAFFLLRSPKLYHKTKFGLKGADQVMNLDNQQYESFLQLAQKHIALMEGHNDNQKKLLKPYFEEIIKGKRMKNPDSILYEVQVLEREKIESTYQHFEDVKALLRPEQYKGFEIFVEHAIERILMNQEKKPHPPKDFE